MPPTAYLSRGTSSLPLGCWRRRSATRCGEKSGWENWSVAGQARWQPPFQRWPSVGWRMRDIGPDAVRLSLALDRPVYDCVYLALAHRIGATLVTADARFANSLAQTEHSSAVVTLKTLQE